MLSAQERGKEFENRVHFLLETTNNKILRENDIRNKYGKNITGIDHLIILSNFLICIQDKLEKKPVCVKDIHHFIHCTNDIRKIEDKKCIGIFLSKMELSGPSKEAFENEKKENRKYVSITGSDEDEILNNLKKILHRSGIFFYESDGSCIMG